MEHGPRADVPAVRDAATALAAALAVAGADADSHHLTEALQSSGPAAEQLLMIRSALVATRNRWEDLPDRDAVIAGRRALAAAKRLAIDV